jgi:hypothetical protein
MKKVLSIFLALLVVGISVAGCKSHERCPAYSKVEQSSKQAF